MSTPDKTTAQPTSFEAAGSIHDPGPEVAGDRAAEVLDAAANPIELRAGGATVRLGTASWTDPTMTAGNVFYPRGVDSAEERLQYYASQFPLVEVDATYYALPFPKMAELWRDRTPPDFMFDVKAHALMTGQPTEVKRLPKVLRDELPPELAGKARIYARDLPAELRDAVWQIFADGLAPLRESGQLGSILMQYPRWFFPISQSRDEILEARDRLGDQPFAVELRNASWFNEKNVERTLALPDRQQAALRDGRRATGLQEQRAADRRGDLTRSGDHAFPRPTDRNLGDAQRHTGRAVPLPLRPRGAQRMGPATARRSWRDA